MAEIENEEEYIDWFLKQAENNCEYTLDQVALIKAVRLSNISDYDKMTLGIELMNSSGDKSHIELLKKRLTEKYSSQEVDAYLDKIIFYNPLHETLAIMPSGCSIDDRESAFAFEIKVSNKDVETIEKDLKNVLRVIIGDAKKS